MLLCDVRDLVKKLVLFSCWGTLVAEEGGYEQGRMIRLESSIPYGEDKREQMSGCAAWPDDDRYSNEHGNAPWPYNGMPAAALFDDGHPTMEDVQEGEYGTSVHERFNHYLYIGCRRGDVRVEVRMIHIPSGRATMLFTSGSSKRPEPVWSEKDGIHGYFTFPRRPLLTSSPVSRLALQLDVRATPEENNVSELDRGKERVGIEGFALHLSFDGDSSTQHELDVVNEIGWERMTYRTLQSLPWTD